MIVWAHMARSAGVPPKKGGRSKSEHSTLMIGKKMGSVAGTVQLRVTGVVACEPARKKTCGVFPLWQLAPDESISGFIEVGMASMVCCHTADNSPYVMPVCADDADG